MKGEFTLEQTIFWGILFSIICIVNFSNKYFSKTKFKDGKIMVDLDLMKQQLIKNEGIKLKPYKDTLGNITIGVGRNLDGVGISEAEAFIMLEQDIGRVINELSKRPYFLAVISDDVRARVLIDMAFNMGPFRLDDFKMMADAIISGNYEAAALEMLSSKWAAQVGQRAVRLSEMMRTGKDILV